MFQHSSSTMNSGDAVGRKTGINYPYALQSTFLLYENDNAEEPYLGINSILGTCNVSALGIHRMECILVKPFQYPE